MPRHFNTASRNAVLKNIEEEVLDAAKSPEIQAQIDEKIAQFRALPDNEKLQQSLNNYVAVQKSEHGNDREYKKGLNIPPEIDKMPEGKKKKEKIKAAAQAALILGHPPGAVAKQYGLGTKLTMEWQHTVLTVGAIGRRDRLSDMILTFIEQEFKSLIAISIVTSDEKWVMRQDASMLAHYVAVKTDRLLILLQAFGKVEEARNRYVSQLDVLEQHK